MVATAGTSPVIRALRVAFAVLGLIALLWIPIRNIGVASFSEVNFLSYFTIQSNILGIVVLVTGGLLDPAGRRWQLIRGAATLYLIITGVTYTVLLANIDVQLTDKWFNDTLHRLIPIVVAAGWVLIPATLPSTADLIGRFLLYPAVYGTYSLIRGAIVDWYPYPFLDPRAQGYFSLVIGLVIMTGVFALLAVGVAMVGNLRSGRAAFAG